MLDSRLGGDFGRHVVSNINWLMLSVSLCGAGIGQELANIR
jgi:hypothetical protein